MKQKLPMPLKQFNELVESQITWERHHWKPSKRRSRAAIEKESREHVKRLGGSIEEVINGDVTGRAERMRREQVFNEATKRWERAGLNKTAAAVAAAEQLSKMTTEDWAHVADGFRETGSSRAQENPYTDGEAWMKRLKDAGW